MKNFLYIILFFTFFVAIQSGYTTTIGNCERGFCPKDYSCISNYCVKGDLQPDPVATTRPTILRNPTSSCSDKDTKCPSMRNLCTNTIYKNVMKQQCSKTCNYC